jgi:hypothetical protein
MSKHKLSWHDFWQNCHNISLWILIDFRNLELLVKHPIILPKCTSQIIDKQIDKGWKHIMSEPLLTKKSDV